MTRLLAASEPELRAAVDWFVRDPDTGRVELAQSPNALIGIFWAATATQYVVRPPEPWATGVAAMRWGSLTWWAGDEVVRGSSPARRTAGALTLLGMVVRLRRRGLR